jgi:hypothetical protein
MPQFGAFLTDGYKVVIYDRNMFTIQVTGRSIQPLVNTLEYCAKETITVVKGFVEQAPGDAIVDPSRMEQWNILTT